MEREIAMGFAADHPICLVRVYIRVVKQPHLELPMQHRGHEIVELLFFEHTPANEFDEVQVATRLGQLDVYARLNRQAWSVYKRVRRRQTRGDAAAARIHDAVQWQADHFEEVPVVVVACLHGRTPLFGPPLQGASFAAGWQIGQKTFLIVRANNCPGAVTNVLGASLQFRISPEWRTEASVEPSGTCGLGISTRSTARSQMGADLFWERRF